MASICDPAEYKDVIFDPTDQPPNKEPKIEDDEEDDDTANFYYTTSDEETEKENPEYQKFMEALNESMCFFALKRPKGVKIAWDRPHPENDKELLQELANFALDWYSKEKEDNGKYELVEVLYASRWLTCAIVHCITFVARHTLTGDEETFRARVRDELGFEVTYFAKFDPKFHPLCWLERRNGISGCNLGG